MLRKKVEEVVPAVEVVEKVEERSIRRDCLRGEHDGGVVLGEGKGGLRMPEVRVCERCRSLFVKVEEK